MQYLEEDELAALITAIHKVNQKSLPLGLFGAGLPQLLGKAGNAKSYSERLFQFEEIGALSKDEANKALVEPAKAKAVHFTDEALDLVFDKSKGYPYFLQEWGSRTWNAAKSSPVTKN